MRASPAFQVTLRRFEIWRIAIFVSAACTGVVAGLWLLTLDHEMSWTVRIALAGPAVAGIALAAGSWRQPARSLRWDGQQWHLGPASSVGNEPWPGTLALMIDLGGWMLLRFDREAAIRRRRSTWIGVQRHGLVREWHALRCAVYSPRPERVGAPLNDSSSLASTRPRPAE